MPIPMISRQRYFLNSRQPLPARQGCITGNSQLVGVTVGCADQPQVALVNSNKLCPVRTPGKIDTQVIDRAHSWLGASGKNRRGVAAIAVGDNKVVVAVQAVLCITSAKVCDRSVSVSIQWAKLWT